MERQVLTNLDAHAFAFQEIVNLEDLLQGIEGHDYRLRKEPGGDWLSSSDPADTTWHKIACAYDADVFELLDAAALENPERYPGYYHRRDPYALHLRERSTGSEITLVAVHFKSFDPRVKVENDQDPERRDLREREAAFLAAWLKGDLEEQPGEEELATEGGPTPYFPKPPSEDVVVMGDYLALSADGTAAILVELKTEGQSRRGVQDR